VWGICAKIRYLVLMGTYGDPRALDALSVRQRPTRPAQRRAAPSATDARNTRLPLVT
jgi:hypothetical protein